MFSDALKKMDFHDKTNIWQRGGETLLQRKKLKELGVKCLFISDNDGRGAMDVFCHPRAVQFAQDSQMAAKFFAFITVRVGWDYFSFQDQNYRSSFFQTSRFLIYTV